MDAIVQTINAAGKAFIDVASPMLVQSGLLIVILLTADAVLRKRVRAVFRYWIWMLVLVKLVLPPSLWSPVSVGTWFGDKLKAPAVAVSEWGGPHSIAADVLSPRPLAPLAEDRGLSRIEARGDEAQGAADIEPMPSVTEPPSVQPPGVSLRWQGLALLSWAAVATVLLLLLLQRAFFVRGLVAQADAADAAMQDALDRCRARISLRRGVGLRLSAVAGTPAACGLIRPVILIPQSLAPRLEALDLNAVLLHELAHIKRGDLWVNLAQTLLQIVYFYNPLLWPANAVIRRTREQAVDEAVLVAMGDAAQRYPETLVNIARLAFRRRPALSLRLLGVVESKSALSARIRHILTRPIPKSAKLGVLGLLVIVIVGVIMLPMAKARPLTDRADRIMALAAEEARALHHNYVGTEHILLALASNSNAVSAKVLEDLGLDKEKLRTEVLKHVRPGSGPVSAGKLPLMPRAHRILEFAEEEAQSLGHDYVGTEHILLALMYQQDSVAAQVLEGAGVTLPQMRAEVRRFVRPGHGVDMRGDDANTADGAAPVEPTDLSGKTQAQGTALIEVSPPKKVEPAAPAPTAKLPNGVTVRFLAYSQLAADGLHWWTSAGEPTKIADVHEADIEGLGTTLAFQVDPPDTFVRGRMHRGSGTEMLEHQWRLGTSDIWLFATGDKRGYVNVEITTQVSGPPAVELVPLTSADEGKTVPVGKLGVAQITGLQIIPAVNDPAGGRPKVPPAVQFTVVNSPGSNPGIPAVEDKEGMTHGFSKYSGSATTERFEVSLRPDQLAAVVVEASPVRAADVKFRNISLTPGHATTVGVEPDSQAQVTWQQSHARVMLDALVGGLASYQNDHDNRVPANLDEVKRYIFDEYFKWLTEHVAYIGQGGLLPSEGSSTPVAYDRTLLPQGKGTYVAFVKIGTPYVQFESPKRLAELGIPNGATHKAEAKPPETSGAATAKSPGRAADVLKQRMDEALPGATVVVPKGTYTTPLEIAKAVVLRGESPQESIIEVTADQPAILVRNVGKGNVTIENLTIRWQLGRDKKTELPAAVLVRDEEATIRNCRFVPLGDAKRSPMAVYIDGKSKSTVDNCRFSGFDYAVCFGQGTEGVVQDCVITDCGHQGIINYDGSTLTVQRNIITGSKFHAVRCTGGTLHVKDNLLIKNANRGIYLGNKTGRGTITNNLIVGNGTGISAFGRADFAIASNVLVDNDYAGIDMRDSCRLSIRNNVLARSQRGVALHKEGAENFTVIGKNAYWANATDVESMDKPEGSVTADPQFVDPNHGDFSVQGPVKEEGHGLTDSSVIRGLWEKYRQLPTSEHIEPAAVKGTEAGSSEQLTQLRQTLLTGDSQTRRQAFEAIRRSDMIKVLDDSFLPAMQAASADSAPSVRNEVARTAGFRWVWSAKDQDPNAIELLLKLASDSEREVRYNAVYYGLSTVRDKSEPVVRRLIEMAMADHENNLYGRIVWGLNGPMKASPELVAKILAEQLDRAKSDVHHAASVYSLYRDVLEKEPPGEWDLARIKDRYPDDLFAVPFGAKESFKPQNEDALWSEFARSLPQTVMAERMPSWWQRGEVVCVAKVRGKEQVNAAKRLIENHPRLSLKEVYPLSLSAQLYLEELPTAARR